MKVYIVIAAYNEEHKIGEVLEGLKGYSVVVVDDGSTDRTYDVARKKRIDVLHHTVNRGQGAALKTGIDYALDQGAEIIVTYDADGQFLASEIPRLINPIFKKKADVVLGSRFKGKTINIPFLKKAVLQLGVFVVFVLYGIRITDSQCGFRALSREAAQKINMTADRMEHAGEIFHEIMINKLKYTEVGVTVIYDNYSLRKGQGWSSSMELGLKMLFKRLMK